MQCYKHPREETNLRCGKCDKPICYKCSIPGPAGMRCPECSSLRSTSLYQIEPHKLILAAIVGLVCGTLTAGIMQFVSFFIFFIGPAIGGGIAEIILWCVGRKRGPVIEGIGVCSIVLGGLIVLGFRIVKILVAAHHHAPGLDQPVNWVDPFDGVVFTELAHFIWPGIGVVLAASTCYARLR